LVGDLEELGRGVWRVRIVGRSLILVNNRDVPVERDSVPVHLLVHESIESTRAVAREVASQSDLLRLYGGWLMIKFPDLWKEVRHMARKTSNAPFFDFRPVINTIGLDEFIRQVGLERMVEEIGLERVIEQVGLERVIEQVGGLDGLVAKLTPAQRRQLRQLLQ
jgi:hypothetical protein